MLTGLKRGKVFPSVFIASIPRQGGVGNSFSQGAKWETGIVVEGPITL